MFAGKRFTAAVAATNSFSLPSDERRGKERKHAISKQKYFIHAGFWSKHTLDFHFHYLTYFFKTSK